MPVQLIQLIWMMSKEPGMAVPGQDEQLIADWSVALVLYTETAHILLKLKQALFKPS